MPHERLTDIEIRLEYQDRTIHELNDVLIAQQGQIDQLQRDLEKFRLLLDGDGQSFGPANDKPPHY